MPEKVGQIARCCLTFRPSGGVKGSQLAEVAAAAGLAITA
ncbi:hypothetical protein [Methylomonas albis]|nr:hypothetical protein [Methylomonas albis]